MSGSRSDGFVHNDQSTLTLYRVQGGTFTALAGTVTTSPAIVAGTTVRLEVEATGTAITVRLNGAVHLTATVSTFATATKHGISWHSVDPTASYDNFSVLPMGTSPAITSLSPSSGAVGTTVTIAGANLGTSGSVKFGSLTASTSAWTATSITTTVPSGAATGPVTVTVGGVVSNGVTFTVPVVPVGAVVWDTFTASTGTALASHAPDVTPGPWVSLGTSAAQVNAGRAKLTTAGNGHQKWVIETGLADVRAAADFRSDGSRPLGGVVVRAVDGQNYLVAYIDQSTLTLYRVQGGAFTTLVGPVTTTPSIVAGTTVRLEVEAVGTALTVRLNGAVHITATVSTFATATRHGLSWHDVDTTAGFDNFEVQPGSPGGGGGSCTYGVSPNGLTVGAAGTSGDFVVTTGPGCFWSISSPAGWLSFSPLAGTGSGSIGCIVHANGGSAARSATITVGSMTMTVSQAGTGTSTPPPPEPGGNETPTALPAAPPGGTPLYYHMDAIGSVRLITDQAGATVQRHDFMPFGGEVNMPPDTAKNPLRFAGKERDPETASTAGALEPLSYFGARHYQNQIGRFATVDPVVPVQDALVDPQRWGRYAYVRNNPLRFVDPDGRELVGAAIGAVAGAGFGIAGQLAANYTAQRWDPSRKLTDGIVQAAAVGLVEGAVQGLFLGVVPAYRAFQAVRVGLTGDAILQAATKVGPLGRITLGAGAGMTGAMIAGGAGDPRKPAALGALEASASELTTPVVGSVTAQAASKVGSMVLGEIAAERSRPVKTPVPPPSPRRPGYRVDEER
jgi:RHS repeat-associated protein